jgi:hypothetical protein
MNDYPESLAITKQANYDNPCIGPGGKLRVAFMLSGTEFSCLSAGEKIEADEKIMGTAVFT